MENTFNKIKKCNPWEGYDIDLGFERSLYLGEVLKFTGNKLVKVIVGQRRCGKSYILRQIIKTLLDKQKVNPKNIFYLNKEYTGYEKIKDATDQEALFLYYTGTLKLKGKIFLFLDETQNIERWESFVNSYSQDFTGEYELFITGSNSNLLSGELATMLSSRYVEFEVLPFSLHEMAEAKNRQTDKLFVLDYLKSGGLPEMLNLQDEELQKHYVEDLRNTIVLRDIMQKNTVKDLTLLDDLFRFVSTNVGSLTSVSDIIDYFKGRRKKTNYETLYVQVAYQLGDEKTVEREFGNLLAIKDNHEKYVVSLDDTKFSNYKGIKHVWPWGLH